MFANLLRLVSRRPAADYERGFITEVRVKRARRRDARVERFIFACWILIAVKHVAIIYAVHRWPVPFHQLWVNFPTWLLGVLATAVYWWRE